MHLATVPGCTTPQESLVREGTGTSLPAKPSPNPIDVGPIVCRPMGLPVGCDRARISSGTARTAMQCLRQLRNSGGSLLTI